MSSPVVRIDLLLPDGAPVTRMLTREIEERTSDKEKAEYFDSFKYDDYQLEEVSD
jgi:hypothetical protein